MLFRSGLGLEITQRMPACYRCDCSKERVEKALVSIGRKDLKEMIDDGEPIEVNCQFCGKHYRFTPTDLGILLERSNR